MTEDVEVYLKNTTTGDEYILLTIPAAEIEEDWFHHADVWQAPADITGALEIGVRYLGTVPIDVDKGGANRGAALTDQYQTHPGERSAVDRPMSGPGG